MRGKKAIMNIISTLILQIITIICGFIVPKLIISTYGSDVNGLLSSITQFLAYVTLLEAGFGPVIKSILYKPVAKNDKKSIEKILKSSENIFKRITYIFIVYVAILCIVLPVFLNKDFDKIYTLSLIIIISISTMFEYYFGMTYKLYLQVNQKNYVISIIQIGTLILNTITILILINLKVSIQIVKLLSSLIFILRPIIQNIYLKKKYNINLKNVESDYKIKQKYDGFAQHIAYIVHTNTDVVILTLFSDMKEVSVYSIYYLVINSIKNIICSSFVSSIESIFGDMIAKKETQTLQESFDLYEGLYLSISSILFFSTFILIVPFVKIYTKGITDVNYIRPIFSYVMVLASFMFVIKQLYYSLVKVSGDFKQTKKGAIIEALSNIVISIILVWKLGLLGVAIGTLISLIIRTIEIVLYTSKNILYRNFNKFIKRIIAITIEFLIVIFIMKIIPQINVTNYFYWIINASIVFVISTITVLLVNYIICKDNIFYLLKFYKNIK